MKKEILRMDHIITEENDMSNLDNFNLHMFQGEIFGLIGVNSLGKEKTIELICKNTAIKFGRIYFADQLVNSYRQNEESYNKVYVLDRKSKLVNDLSVTDNVFVLRKGFRKYCINRRVLKNQLNQLMKEIEVDLNTETVAMKLTEYERCVVEILKAMIQGMKLIIVNDISNVLSANELRELKTLLIKMAEKGYSVLYIGNHHEDVFSICNRVAFMKDGKIIKIFDKKEMQDEKVLPFTISFEDTNQTEQKKKRESRVFFNNISCGYLKNISFQIQQGECIVLYDKTKKLQEEVIDCLLGNQELEHGTIEVDGEIIDKNNIRQKFGTRIGIIGEEATKTMLFYDMNYIDNLCFLIDRKTHRTRISAKVKKSIQKEYYSKLGGEVYASDLNTLNKKSLYNLVYYRMHLLNPKIVFIVQPFSNADMYVRRHIIHLIRELKRKGITVIIVAVTISDSLYVADKFLLLENGMIQKEYLPEHFADIRVNI